MKYNRTLITYEWLVKRGACKRQAKKFNILFPDGAKLTLRNLWLAVNHKLDVVWFANYFLSWEDNLVFRNELSAIDNTHYLFSHEYDMRYTDYRNYVKQCIKPLWKIIRGKKTIN